MRKQGSQCVAVRPALREGFPPQATGEPEGRFPRQSAQVGKPLRVTLLRRYRYANGSPLGGIAARVAASPL